MKPEGEKEIIGWKRANVIVQSIGGRRPLWGGLLLRMTFFCKKGEELYCFSFLVGDQKYYTGLSFIYRGCYRFGMM